MRKKYLLKSNKGVTGIDIVVAVIIIVVFTGIVSTLMYNSYLIGLEILKSANASAYATIILEKVDEKAFEDVTDNFVDTLISNNELELDSSYTVEFVKQDVNEIIKKVDLNINYTVGNSNKTLSISKLKIKEIGD